MKSSAIRDTVILLAATGILAVLAHNGRYGSKADLEKIHELITTEAIEETEEMETAEIVALIEESETESNSAENISEEESEVEQLANTEVETETVSAGFVMYSSIWDKVQMSFYEDGSCTFEMPDYNVEEACTWVYQEGVLTVTRQDGVIFTSYIAENVQSLKLDYQAMINEELVGQFDSLDYKTFFEK